MSATCLLRLTLRLLAILLWGSWAAQAVAQNDPPGRIGRLNHIEGAVTFSPAGDNEWLDAEVNRPLTRGDKLWTDKGARAELQVGSSAVRINGRTRLELLALDDQSAQLSVLQGTVYVRVRSLPEGENFEVDTPNLAYRAAYPGDYRIDVDPARGTTRVTIHSGTGAVYGESGQALPLGGGQQITFRGRSLAQVGAQESPPQDIFDRWAAERNRREDQSVSARFVPREVVGYQSLDAHGQWTQDATHGPVWIPHGTPANWAPYRFGRWEWIGPWGWTWIDDAPWGFAPSHYGRWAKIGSRWAWVPGRIGLRPIYAPALVAFIGGGGSGAAWSIPVAAGRPGVAWFPLAPGEAWQPGYKATPIYVSNVNRNMPPQPAATHAHQGRPEALTAISAEDFHRGRPVRGSWLRVAANVLTKAQVVPPPPIPEPVLAAKDKPANASATAPAQPDIRQVAAGQAPAQGAEPAKPQPIATAADAAGAEQARIAEQARLAEQARVAERSRLAEQARAAELAKAAAQQRKEQQARAVQRQNAAQQARAAAAQRALQAAKAAEQARRIEIAKAEESARRERQAKRAEPAGKREPRASQAQARREGAKREQLAARAELARRDEQARKTAQAQRQAIALREEKARRETHAQRVEMARRAAERDAEALRVQREAAQREAARREGIEREQAQRAAWERQQQALSEQWRRDHQAWEQQQRERTRQRPDLRNDHRPAPPPEVWQRGIPILNPGRTS